MIVVLKGTGYQQLGGRRWNTCIHLWTSCWSLWDMHCILFLCLGHPKVEIKSLEWMMLQQEELPLSSSILTSTGLRIHILIPRKKLCFVMVPSYLTWSALKWNLGMEVPNFLTNIRTSQFITHTRKYINIMVCSISHIYVYYALLSTQEHW